MIVDLCIIYCVMAQSWRPRVIWREMKRSPAAFIIVAVAIALYHLLLMQR